MRKTTLGILMLSLVAVVMTSCNLFKSEQERKIVGKWFYSDAAGIDTTTQIIDEGMTTQYFSEYYITYGKDNKFTMQGLTQVTANLYDEYSITLKYKVASNGTWEIKDGRLYERPSDANITFAGMELSDPNLYELQQAANEWKHNNTPIIAELKSDFLTPSDSKIVNVDDNELVLSDKDGTMTFRRLN